MSDQDRCAACGRLVTTVRAPSPLVTLNRVWVHYSWWANRTHRAIPRSYVRPPEGDR